MVNDNIHINNQYERGETLNTGRLFRGEQHLSAGDEPAMAAIAPQNGSGDIVGNPAYVLPGQPVLIHGSGTYGVMPARALQGNITFYPMQNPDGYIYYDRVIYRSDLTGYRDGPNMRLAPSSPTTPGNRYRFLDGRRGDVYG